MSYQIASGRKLWTNFSVRAEETPFLHRITYATHAAYPSFSNTRHLLLQKIVWWDQNLPSERVCKHWQPGPNAKKGRTPRRVLGAELT